MSYFIYLYLLLELSVFEIPLPFQIQNPHEKIDNGKGSAQLLSMPEAFRQLWLIDGYLFPSRFFFQRSRGIEIEVTLRW